MSKASLPKRWSGMGNLWQPNPNPSVRSIIWPGSSRRILMTKSVMAREPWIWLSAPASCPSGRWQCSWARSPPRTPKRSFSRRGGDGWQSPGPGARGSTGGGCKSERPTARTLSAGKAIPRPLMCHPRRTFTITDGWCSVARSRWGLIEFCRPG